MIRNTKNRIRNNPANNFAIVIDAPAMVVNPRSAAMKPMTRDTSAVWSISSPPVAVGAKLVPLLVKLVIKKAPHLGGFDRRLDGLRSSIVTVVVDRRDR